MVTPNSWQGLCDIQGLLISMTWEVFPSLVVLRCLFCSDTCNTYSTRSFTITIIWDHGILCFGIFFSTSLRWWFSLLLSHLVPHLRASSSLPRGKTFLTLILTLSILSAVELARRATQKDAAAL